MNLYLRKLLKKVQSTADFCSVSFETINDTNALGDNALHCICVWGDIEAAKILVENGIYINQRGEGNFTPLNVALDFEHKELADYLISCGADSSVVGAEFEFNREKNSMHLKDIKAKTEVLDEQIGENFTRHEFAFSKLRR